MAILMYSKPCVAIKLLFVFQTFTLSNTLLLRLNAYHIFNIITISLKSFRVLRVFFVFRIVTVRRDTVFGKFFLAGRNYLFIKNLGAWEGLR